MNTFICWSQSRSRQIADSLREWLPRVLPGEEFFLSSDIEKGTLWFEALRDHLKRADAAIICLTPDNINSPWMHFEVGAIAGEKAESLILTYLFGVNPADISGPLAAFQSSNCNQEDTRKLVLALGKICHKTAEKFEALWPDLEAKLANVRPIRVPDLIPGFGDFLNFKTFREPLEDCPDQGWLDRFARLVQVRERLQKEAGLVTAQCNQVDSTAYQQILSELDKYLRFMRSQLVIERQFRRVNGKLDFKDTDWVPLLEDADWVPPSVAEVCQRLKDKVRALGGNVPQSEAPQQAASH